MENNITVDREATRHTFNYNFQRESLAPFREVGKLVIGHNETIFSDYYGHILSLLFTHVNDWPLFTLVQFYDPALRCFTFSDYQLAPSLEEYSCLLKIKIQHKVPFLCVPEKPRLDLIAGALHLSLKEVHDMWKKSSDTHGFYLSSLIEKVHEAVKEGKWETFNALLVVMIYGIVMFPNIPNFIDLVAICVFMDKNHVPMLLADTYFSIHSRYGKKGAIRGCLPLLYNWFKSHLPVSGPFVTTRDTHKWSQRIMGLVANDIVWYQLSTGISEVIIKCGDFDNVPLVGTRGCINYNPMIALRQMGYTIKDKPSGKEVYESVYFENGIDPDMLERIRKVWTNICVAGRPTLGKKNAIVMQAYTDWVKDIVKTLMFPFPRVPLLYEQPLEIVSI